MTATAFFGLLGCGLLCVAFVAVALRLHRFPVRIRAAVALAAAVALFVPIGDLPLAAYVRGATGDPSIATLVLAGSACSERLGGRSLFGRTERSVFLGLLAAASLFLYPFALGWTPFDPYAMGYGSVAMVLVLFLVTLAAWQRGWNQLALVILIAAAACLGGLYESRNLWDYLIDPLAAAYALVVLSWAGARRLVSRRRQRAPVI